MLLTSLELTDFGPFVGTHEIALRPKNPDAPLVIISGSNGSGKTTLLEAVQLCLYGRRGLGGRVTRTEYDRRLGQLFHVRLAATATAEMHVAVSFEHTEAGRTRLYRVERIWRRHGRRITDSFVVTCDGRALAGRELSRWEDFLFRLLPPTLAELSFFDAERIQVLADDYSGAVMARAIQELLGLDTIRRLQDDLALFISRQGSRADEQLHASIARLREERLSRSSHAAHLHEQLAAAEAELGTNERKLAVIEEELAQHGGAIAARRAELTSLRRQHDAKARDLRTDIAELCADALPLAIAPLLLTRTRDTLEAERRGRLQALERQAAGRVARQLRKPLSDPDWRAEAVRLGLSDEQAVGLLKIVARRFSESASRAESTPSLGLANLDEPLEALRSASTQASRARRLAHQLGDVESELRDVDDELQRAPEPARIEPLLERLKREQAQLGRLSARVEALHTELDDVVSANRRIDVELQRLIKQAGVLADQERQVALAAAAAGALTDFADRLTRSRVAEIEMSLKSSLGQLLTAPLVSDVHIEPETFAVTLLDQEGRTIDRVGLSAGQRQIYAMAFLKGLASASRRRLPLIIDSPLGRLDMTHRSMLAERYFAAAGEQVVMLVTDSEVDQSLMASLAAATSYRYVLHHDRATRQSVIGSAPGSITPSAGRSTKHGKQEPVATG